MFGVLIVGGGSAGLSAAMTLARCRRSVLLVDAGSPCKARSQALHRLLGVGFRGFLE